MSKTGGGRGTNQYAVKGTSQTSAATASPAPQGDSTAAHAAQADPMGPGTAAHGPITKQTARSVGAALRQAGLSTLGQGKAPVSGNFVSDTGYRVETHNRHTSRGTDSRGRHIGWRKTPEKVLVEVGVSRRDRRQGQDLQALEATAISALERAGYRVEGANGNGQFFVTGAPPTG